MESFRVDYRHPVVDDCRTEVASPQVGTVGMRPAVGILPNWPHWPQLKHLILE